MSKHIGMSTPYLFLDDHQERSDLFLHHCHTALIANNAKDMIELIKKSKQPISAVFLDHDLDDNGYVPGLIEGTGMEVVQWIVNNQPAIEVIIVHSRNIHGSISMCKALHKANYRIAAVPFFDLPLNDIQRFVQQIKLSD